VIMRARRLQSFTLILCVALLGGMAHARTNNKAARRSPGSPSARQAGVASLSKGEHTRNTATKKNWPKRGQQMMHPERVREVQAALIREHYLKGRANGVWDQRSKDAMARFQSDNRWQFKVVPDSRALIKLGLGPDHAGLINPDTAAITFVPGGATPTSTLP
jgi:peptidoglycan hydrolase-like protein with peptidoglycan-binding domain